MAVGAHVTRNGVRVAVDGHVAAVGTHAISSGVVEGGRDIAAAVDVVANQAVTAMDASIIAVGLHAMGAVVVGAGIAIASAVGSGNEAAVVTSIIAGGVHARGAGVVVALTASAVIAVAAATDMLLAVLDAAHDCGDVEGVAFVRMKGCVSSNVLLQAPNQSLRKRPKRSNTV